MYTKHNIDTSYYKKKSPIRTQYYSNCHKVGHEYLAALAILMWLWALVHLEIAWLDDLYLCEHKWRASLKTMLFFYMILTSNTEATENKVQFLNFAYTVKGF